METTMRLMLVCIFVFMLDPVYAAMPIIQDMVAPSSINLVAGETTNITCNATVTDSDGFGNISIVSAVLYDRAAAQPESIDDNNTHYSAMLCETQGSGETMNLTCIFGLWYYASASPDWICNITMSDGGDVATGSANTSVSELRAMSTSGINYAAASGNISLGGTSDESSLNIMNIGNVDISIEVSGTPLNCTVGSISAGNQVYNLTSGFITGTPLSANPTQVSGFLVPARIDDTAPSASTLYWRLSVPATGVGGTCDGTISVDAV
jgi:hypothetical protein